MRLKLLRIITTGLLLYFVLISNAFASQDISSLPSKEMENLDLSQIESYINQVDRDVGKYLPDLDLSRMFEDLKQGKLKIDLQSFFPGLLNYFWSEILVNINLLGILIVLAVLYAVLENIHYAFAENSLSKITFWVCGLALLTIALGSFTFTIGIARETVDKMVSFFNSLLPLLITLIVSVGHFSSAALLNPVTLASTAFFSNIINQIVIPLIYISSVLFILDHINDRFKVTYLAKLCKDVSMWIIGLSLTIYIGILGIQGIAGGVTDGIALKTAKFATGNFIPVVGGFLSDALETVVGTSLLIKSGVSMIGMLLIILICIFPMLKILSVVIIYRVAAALVQPFGAKPIAEALQTIGNCLLLVFGAVASIALMLFMALSIMVKVGRPF
ncbi:stage III sporulation protein AE [Bacillota bacterium LX-D]|nr:stage III sporulation protein AE [Bacillota bacterium LX-D]